jgi:hypothetical protein
MIRAFAILTFLAWTSAAIAETWKSCADPAHATAIVHEDISVKGKPITITDYKPPEWAIKASGVDEDDWRLVMNHGLCDFEHHKVILEFPGD